MPRLVNPFTHMAAIRGITVNPCRIIVVPEAPDLLKSIVLLGIEPGRAQRVIRRRAGVQVKRPEHLGQQVVERPWGSPIFTFGTKKNFIYHTHPTHVYTVYTISDIHIRLVLNFYGTLIATFLFYTANKLLYFFPSLLLYLVYLNLEQTCLSIYSSLANKDRRYLFGQFLILVQIRVLVTIQ